MISAILVDDEIECLDVLEAELLQYCPDIHVIAKFSNPPEAQKFIENTNFDVLFLDISMPKMNGFELLRQVKVTDFSVVFVTAYDSFALTAFDFCAVDYLVKPTSKESLLRAAERLREKRKTTIDQQNIALLLANMQNGLKNRQNIAVSTIEGLEFIAVQQISHAEADGNYTRIHLINNEKILITKTLKDLEGLLGNQDFSRIHNSFLVNMQHVKKYVKGDIGMVVMNDGTTLQVSRANKVKLMNMAKFGL